MTNLIENTKESNLETPKKTTQKENYVKLLLWWNPPYISEGREKQMKLPPW